MLDIDAIYYDGTVTGIPGLGSQGYELIKDRPQQDLVTVVYWQGRRGRQCRGQRIRESGR